MLMKTIITCGFLAVIWYFDYIQSNAHFDFLLNSNFLSFFRFTSSSASPKPYNRHFFDQLWSIYLWGDQGSWIYAKTWLGRSWCCQVAHSLYRAAPYKSQPDTGTLLNPRSLSDRRYRTILTKYVSIFILQSYSIEVAIWT